MSKDLAAQIHEFSFHDPETMQDPYPFYAAVRQQCPLARSEALGGFYFAANFSGTKRIYEDWKTFSSAEGTALPRQPMLLYPEDLDPPTQTKYRKILNPRFTPEFVARFRGKLEAHVARLIDGFIASGSADLLDDVVRPMLANTVIPMLGIPLDGLDMVAGHTDFINRKRTIDPQGVQERSQELAGYLIQLVATRRQQDDQPDDILGILLHAQIDGAPIGDQEIFSVLMILLFGGLDTTTAVLGEALFHLAKTPADAERLRSGEVPYATAIEEFVRYASPIQAMRRTVRQEANIGGCILKPGDMIIAMSGAANRDPAVFDRSDEILIDRDIPLHLAFGAGAHICLGRNFARLAMEVTIRAILDRIPDFHVAPDFHPEYAVGEGRGMKALPIHFRPRQIAA